MRLAVTSGRPRRLPAMLLACALAPLTAAVAQESTDQEAPSTRQDEEQAQGYPVERERLVGGPTDVATDLIRSFPKRDSLFPSLIPAKWFSFKEKLYDKTGVKLSFSYQSLYQQGSETLELLESDYAWGGWLLFEAKWNAFRTGEDYEGGLTATIDWRHAIGGGVVPSVYGPFGVGSLWLTDIGFDEWDPALPVFYWEQWLNKDVFVLRIGKQLASQTYDFFRFKDSRTSFAATPFTLHNSIPTPGFGQAISFEWWPRKNSELYVQGTVNDMNGAVDSFGLDTFWQDRQHFYGFEVGYFWKRNFPADFDHIHLDVFYADERAEPTVPGFPNKAGGGFKILGSKQRRRLVGFGSYTYNTSEGGGFSVTFARHTVTAGVAVLKPAGIRGEVGVGMTWMEPIDDAVTNQSGGEVYWKLLLTPDLWFTPGLQFIWNPAFNPDTDFVAVPQIKFRLFF